MDHQWAAEKLNEFIDLIDNQEQDEGYLKALVNGYQPPDADASHTYDVQQEVELRERQLKVMEPGVMTIMEAAQPGLGGYEEAFDLTDPDGDPIFTYKRRWEPAKLAAMKAVGLHTFGAEAEQRMKPTAPDLAADQFHPWVWEAARPMWEAGSLQSALQHASSSMNARLKQKLDRHDVSDRKLCAEAFSFDPPAPGKPRLRFPGNRDTETWKALQGGASVFGQGCFTAIRNPVSHDHEHPVSKQEALEQLAALSVFARWVDQCEVETAE